MAEDNQTTHLNEPKKAELHAEAPPVIIDSELERPHLKRPRVSFFEEWRRGRPRVKLDNSFRNFIILASVLGVVAIILCVLIIDQLAFGGKIKNSALAVFVGSTEEPQPSHDTETDEDVPKPNLGTSGGMHDNTKESENIVPSAVNLPESSQIKKPDPLAAPLSQEELELIEREDKEREAQIAEDERLLAEQQAAKKVREEAEARLLAEERRKIAEELRIKIARGVLELPKFLEFNTPRLSPFGRIEERQLESKVFPEFAPFYPVLNEIELKFVDFYTDPVWMHSLVRDSRTSLSRGWNLRASDGKKSLDLARFVITEDGLKVVWNDCAREIANLDTCNKLAFARIEIKVDFEGVVFADSVSLLAPTRVPQIEYKTEMRRANPPKTVIPNVFAVPQWDLAFKGIDLQDRFDLEVELASVLPKNYEMQIGGSGDKRFIEFRSAATESEGDAKKEPLLLSITAEVDKNSIVFSDTSFETLKGLQTEKSRLRNEIRGEENENTPEKAEKEARIAEIDELSKRIEKAKSDLKDADLRFHYRLYLNGPDYDRIQNPGARLLLLGSNL